MAPVVFLLCLGEDQVGEDEGRHNREEGLSDPPEGVGKTLGEGPSKSFLFQGRNVVLGGSTDGHSEGSEAETVANKGGSHCIEKILSIINAY